jgi:Mrp family chromosome partitioning ATPase/capsular polysaccharide biosynthesis protein
MHHRKLEIGGHDRRGKQSFARVRIAVYRRLKAIIALPILLAACATAAVQVMPDWYAAATVIQIDPRPRPIAAPALRPSEQEMEETGIASEIAKLQSPPVVHRVVDELGLADDPEFTSYLPNTLFAGLISGTSPQASVEATVARRLDVARLRKTLLIGVRFSSRDAQKAARIANAVVDAYLKEQAEEKWRFRSALLKTAAHGTAAPGATAKPSASEKMFASLVSRYGAALQVLGSRVVTRAEPPQKPDTPKRAKIVAIVFAAGLLAATGLAVLLERAPAGGGRTRRVERELACPHMTSVPALIAKDAETASARACRLVLADPKGAYAEAVRDACEALGQRRAGARSRLLLVVSALPGEGAELLASNIAHHFAVAGGTPLLVDADLRLKTLTRHLADTARCGLLDQIASRQPVEQAVLRDIVTGLHFLPASGPAPTPLSPSDALRSASFAHAVADLKARFPTIVMSAPPLLPVSDSRLLAGLADEIVFVTAWQKTPARLAKKALASIGKNQSKLAGAILTDIAADDAEMMSFADILHEIRSIASRGTAMERAA